jgi:ribonuclease-3
VSYDLALMVEARLGYRCRQPEQLLTAVTHRSVAGASAENNETLEFLGDAVLGLTVADLLMRRHPSAREGELSMLRADLVNAAVLAAKARTLDLGAWLRLGKGEERSGGRDKESILASAYEALLGAIFLDGGYDAVCAVVGRAFGDDATVAESAGAGDYKTRLQELTQRRFRLSPVYRPVDEQGPDHAKRFVVELAIDGRVMGCGTGASKKAAEQAAAMQALARIEEDEHGSDG